MKKSNPINREIKQIAQKLLSHHIDCCVSRYMIGFYKLTILKVTTTHTKKSLLKCLKRNLLMVEWTNRF